MTSSGGHNQELQKETICRKSGSWLDHHPNAKPCRSTLFNICSMFLWAALLRYWSNDKRRSDLHCGFSVCFLSPLVFLNSQSNYKDHIISFNGLCIDEHMHNNFMYITCTRHVCLYTGTDNIHIYAFTYTETYKAYIYLFLLIYLFKSGFTPLYISLTPKMPNNCIDVFLFNFLGQLSKELLRNKC